MAAQRVSTGIGLGRQVNWRGRSGRVYALAPEHLDGFALRGDAVHLLALGSNVLWVGGADEVINDAPSRARFRLALDCADRAFELAADGDGVARMTIVWDLEGAEPLAGLSAA
jgi:hypothetical protein